MIGPLPSSCNLWLSVHVQYMHRVLVNINVFEE